MGKDSHCTKFDIGFWHPFGPHGQETPKEIVERNRAEIDANGWTLWSFQYRPMLTDWHRELLSAERNGVFVFCSEGRGAVDPAEGTLNRSLDCQSYRFVGDEDSEWRRMPQGVRVIHPFRPGKKWASAFVVRRIVYPVERLQLPAVEWFSPNKGPWCQDKIPTRGEYLIRPGGITATRNIAAVLELKSPYLAIVTTDKVGGANL
ncbi:MAG: hypothetical protein ACYDC3_18305 [Candidatus Binataceae bacterium]